MKTLLKLAFLLAVVSTLASFQNDSSRKKKIECSFTNSEGTPLDMSNGFKRSYLDDDIKIIIAPSTYTILKWEVTLICKSKNREYSKKSIKNSQVSLKGFRGYTYLEEPAIMIGVVSVLNTSNNKTITKDLPTYTFPLVD